MSRKNSYLDESQTDVRGEDKTKKGIKHSVKDHPNACMKH